MRTIKAFVERHALAAYFVLAFLVSWGAVLLAIGGLAGIPATAAESERLFPLAFLAMLAGPSVAGILMTILTQGADGLRELRSRLFRWRVGARWYALALLAAPVLTLGVLLALSRLSRDFLPAIFGATDKTPLLLSGLVVALGAGVFEELGWTGFAIPRLRLRHGVLATGLLLGMLWGAWHILVNFWASGTPHREISWVFMIPVLLSTVGLGMLPAYRVLMVWVYDRTGSLLLGMLMHISLTASLVILRPRATGMSLVTYELAWAAVLWVFITVLMVAQGRRRSGQSLRRRQRTGRTPALSRPA